MLRVLNKQFLGIVGDAATAVAKKPPPPPVVSRKPAFIDAFLYKMKKNPSLLSNKTIWSRRSTILPEFADTTVKIYNGKTTIRCKITEGKVGHKFGEFALTRKRKTKEQANAKNVKQLKKKKWFFSVLLDQNNSMNILFSAIFTSIWYFFRFSRFLVKT